LSTKFKLFYFVRYDLRSRSWHQTRKVLFASKRQ